MTFIKPVDTHYCSPAIAVNNDYNINNNLFVLNYGLVFRYFIP